MPQSSLTMGGAWACGSASGSSERLMPIVPGLRYVLCFVFRIYFIEVWLIYNVVLISTVQQGNSVIYLSVCILFLFFFLCSGFCHTLK